MRFLALATLALVSAGQAEGAVITGRDCANQDLVCDGSPVCGGAETCSSGDQLNGTFTRVRLFSVPAASTVTVFPGTPLVIYASTVAIGGTLDGTARGAPGGAGGPINGAGTAGTGGGPGFIGGGGGATAANKGGGGGGYGGLGGTGPGLSDGGAAGEVSDSTGVYTSPISSDDVFMGSGGGGGGGDNARAGGAGAPGGASLYLEASSITIFGAGSILVNGGSAQPVTDTAIDAHPGGGGGGSGGGILLRARVLELTGTGSLSANGGKGADAVAAVGGSWNPGGGGGGGRVKLFCGLESPPFAITLSTAGGPVGVKTSGVYEATSTANNGSSGTLSFGIIASSPAAVAVDQVFLTSVSWAWAFELSRSTWGDAPEASRRFRVYPSTVMAPLPGYHAEASSAALKATEPALRPNTWYTRVVSAFTDWGGSAFSDAVTTVTYAGPPGPPVNVSTFTDVQERQLTLNWGPGSGAEANPSDTEYEVWRSTLADFAVASSTRIVAVSSTPVNLTPETVYYFRIRAVNRAGTLTPFTTTFAIATSTTPPSAPGSPVPDNPFSYDGRAVFRWSAASAPSGIKEYYLEVGSFPGGADFLSRSVGGVLSYTVAGPLLQTGRTYYARVRAISNANVTSDFSAAGPPVSVFVTAQETPVAKPSSWPNPLDPSVGPANIGFSVSEPATVQLKIFTLQGKLVYEESRRYDTLGNKVWLWDGKASGGRKVAPGGYVVVIHKRYAGRVDTQKFKMAVLY